MEHGASSAQAGCQPFPRNAPRAQCRPRAALTVAPPLRPVAHATMSRRGMRFRHRGYRFSVFRPAPLRKPVPGETNHREGVMLDANVASRAQAVLNETGEA